MLEAKNDAGGNDLLLRVRGHHRIEAERGGLQKLAVRFNVLAQLDAEVVQREFVQGDAFAEIFKVEDFLPELEQLFVPVAEICVDQFFDFVGLEDVIFKRGSNVHQGHARFDAILEIDVFFEVLGGPEVDQLDGGVDAADTVNAAKALDDPDRIPVNVVIDEQIAVLEVLALGNAIGGDKQVNLLGLRHGGHFGAVFGARGEVGQDLVEIGLAERGVVVATAGHQRDVDAQLPVRPGH